MLIRSQLDRDRANPPLVGGLDMDRKWIITGNEVITWQAHLLIEAHIYRRRLSGCRTVQETNALLYVGSRQCYWLNANNVYFDIRTQRYMYMYIYFKGQFKVIYELTSLAMKSTT